MSYDKLTLDDQLCFALYAATNAVTRAYKPHLEKVGITYPQYLVLLVLWQDGAKKVGEIAERLHLQPNAITPLVHRLEKSGLVTRQQVANDRRIVCVALTDKGAKLEADILRARNEVICQSDLQPEQLIKLRDDLKLLLSRMQPPAKQVVAGPANQTGKPGKRKAPGLSS